MNIKFVPYIIYIRKNIITTTKCGYKPKNSNAHMLARKRKERRQQKGRSLNLFLLRIIMDIDILLQAIAHEFHFQKIWLVCERTH